MQYFNFMFAAGHHDHRSVWQSRLNVSVAAGIVLFEWRRRNGGLVRIDAIMTKCPVQSSNARKVMLFVVAGILAVTVPFAPGTLWAQTGGAAPISYVASVKPNNSAEPRSFTEYYPGGRLSAIAVSVRSLLRTAYRIQDCQLVGAPAWFSTKRYDIAAKVEENPPTIQVFLRTLLADRFKLVVHNETREQTRFALVLARSDGKLGPRLLKSDFDCAAYAATPHALPGPAQTPACAARINMGLLSGKPILMAQLATSLAPFVNRFVADKTGLAGRYDVELTWTPDQVSSTATASPDAVRNDSGAPSIFTALQEQLGLKLVSERGLVEVLVVDRAEQPEPE